MAPFFFVQPKRASWNNFLSWFIFITFFHSHCFLLLSISVFSLSPALKVIRYTSPKLSFPSYKGLGLDIMLVEEQDFNILQMSKVFKSLYFKRLCDFTFFILLLSNFNFLGKTSCMIQQYFQNCCIYPLWILCDCTVLYLSIYYWQLHGTVCLSKTTHTLKRTHNTHTESLITCPIL